MNCQNKSSVGGRAKAAIKKAMKIGAVISDAVVALRLIDKRAEIFTFVEVELLEREIFLEPLADLIEPILTSILVST